MPHIAVSRSAAGQIYAGLILLVLSLLAAVPSPSAQAQIIRLRSGDFDPLQPTGAPALQAGSDAIRPLAAGERQVAIVQWHTELDDAKLQGLLQMGAQLLHPLGDDSYLMLLPAEISALSVPTLQAQAGEPTRWSGPMQPAWKIHVDAVPEVEGTRLSDDGVTTPLKYNVQIIKTGAEQAVQQFLTQAGATVSVLGDINHSIFLMVAADAATVIELARFNSVVWIEPHYERRGLGERGALTIAGKFNDTRSAIAAPGRSYQDWLDSVGLSGEGMIVHVMDDGLSKGNSTNQPGMAHEDINGRIVGIRNATYEQWGDSIGGHGHLCASIIMGNPVIKDGIVDAGGYLLGQGVAPRAWIYATKIIDGDGWVNFRPQFSLPGLVAEAYNSGARVSSNSWGADVGGSYTIDAQIFDMLTRDALTQQNGLQEMTFVFAAGNAGQMGSIGSPATAKNVISVGASENFDAEENCRPSSYFGPDTADDLRDIAFFSSRGPTADGRIAPTVTSVGTHVTGAASDSVNFNAGGVSGRERLEKGEPGDYWRYYPAFQNSYTWSNGTSFACPLVAGAVVLFQEHYKKKFGTLPSPAIVKAALIAGAVDQAGGRTNIDDPTEPRRLGYAPNSHQGWGMASLANIVDDARTIHYVDQSRIFTHQGETFVQKVWVTDPTQPFRVVLTWTDAAGMAAVNGRQLVNDLDLTVSNGVETWKGNVIPFGESLNGTEYFELFETEDAHDKLNNVECVFMPNPSPGYYTITVQSSKIAGDARPNTGQPLEQDFALVVMNGEDMSELGQVSFDKHLYNCKDTMRVTVIDKDLEFAGTTWVLLETLTGGDMEYLTVAEVGSGSGLLRGTLPVVGGAVTREDGSLQVSHGEKIRVRYFDASVNSSGAQHVAIQEVDVDCQAPNLIRHELSGLTDSSVTISVGLDEPAVIELEYSTDPTFEEDVFRLYTLYRATDQDFYLADLDYGTKYYYRFRLIDEAGNVADAANGSSPFGFVTIDRVFKFFDDLEWEETPDPNPWSTVGMLGESAWQRSGSPARYSRSRTHTWQTTVPNSYADTALMLTTQTLPVGNVLMEFFHVYQFDSVGFSEALEGGVLEIGRQETIIDPDGNENIITAWYDLGPYILEGRYNGFIEPPSDPTADRNRLAGRSVWSGYIQEPRRVKVDLTEFAGEMVHFRWRMGSDNVENTIPGGWYIDDVWIYELAPPITDQAQLNIFLDKTNCSSDEILFEIRDEELKSYVPPIVDDPEPGDEPPPSSGLTFLISVPGRIPPTLVYPEMISYEWDPRIWHGRLKITAAGTRGMVRIGDAIEVGNGEIVKLAYIDPSADGIVYEAFDTIYVDCIAPSVVRHHLVSVTDHSATIELAANEAAIMRIHYGPAPGNLDEMVESAYGTTATLTLTNLTKCTPYNYEIELLDGDGNSKRYKNHGELFGFSTLQNQQLQVDQLEPMPAPGWQHGALIGTSDWGYTFEPDSWNYASRIYARSPSHAWSTRSTEEPKDVYLIMPPLTIQPQMQLTFWHTYAFEPNYDGAVIEISTDGGLNWQDLGPHITQGQYVAVINNNFSSSIANRWAWTGDMNGNGHHQFGPMSEVRVDLEPFIGEDRLIRFRHVCDQDKVGLGWMIDNIGTLVNETCDRGFPTLPETYGPAPDPVSGTHMAFPSKLVWSGNPGERYQVWFGTSPDDLYLLAEVDTPEVDLWEYYFRVGERYYWRLRTFNQYGASNIGPVWSFLVKMDPKRIARHLLEIEWLTWEETYAVDFDEDEEITLEELIQAINLGQE